MMRRFCVVSVCLASWAAVMCISSIRAQDKPAPSVNYQKVLNQSVWHWPEQEAGPLYCLTQGRDKYDVRMFSDHGKPHALVFTLLEGEREAWTWTGNHYSVFHVVGDRLYYAVFNPGASGASIVAVDLKAEKKLWESPVRGIGSVEHSAYWNRLALGADEHRVMIVGNEAMGRYMECKDINTGETIAHRIFKDKETPAKEDER